MRWAGELTRRERRAAHATLAPALRTRPLMTAFCDAVRVFSLAGVGRLVSI